MPDETEAPATPPAPPAAPPSSAVPSPPAAPAEPAPPPEDWAVKYRYLFADFENYRRRTEREREGVSRQVRAGLLRELLPILEAFRNARDALHALPPTHPVRHGLELLEREWATFLKHEGVAPVAEVGQPFHPAEQEAVGEAPPRDGVPEGAIAEVVQQGYRFYGGVLRPAKVVVAHARTTPALGAGPPPQETA
jgi:molecular chaperone GrpE